MDKGLLAQRYAAVKAGLPPHVALVAVSKTRTAREVQALYDLGHRDFGENYPQELREKAPQLPDDVRWHFIGHLQRSNVRHVLPFVHLVHGVDSARLLDEIEKRAAAMERTVHVLLQVHIARESTKHGLTAEEARALMHTAHDRAPWPHVRLRGLMGMATHTPDEAQVAGEFNGLRTLFHELRTAHGGPGFDTLSMGMSGDAPIAIAAGSTMVRIGTAIFGER
ncbi:MAG: YggS family pyridoxal phosphate-dependent enzyme [Flavobacteriales bacterium]|jgi:pyridoxal phosphate enzyme (YggS family)|nr:YggS family pyridoxal phosphate-dependent enzyme [Flavobacteriales bacterium]